MKIKTLLYFLCFSFATFSCGNNENNNDSTYDITTNRIEDSFTVTSESQTWINVNDQNASNDSNFITGLQFQRKGTRKGHVGYSDVMDNNLHITNFSLNGSIEFQTEGTTKAAISPDGWIQTQAGLWFGPEVPVFFNATQARKTGLVDGQSFIRRADGVLIVLRKGIN